MGLSMIVTGLCLFAWLWFSTSEPYLEREVTSAEECLPGEYYDEGYRICYFEFTCETEKECAEEDKVYESLLVELDALYSEPTEPHIYGDHDDFDESDEMEYFAITDGQLPNTDAESKNEKAESLWLVVSTLVPEKYRNKIISFDVYSRPRSDTIAYVEPTADSLRTWKMRVNTAQVYDSESESISDTHGLFSTLVHELAHIITLDDTQIQSWGDNETCPVSVFELQEGCAKDGSYVQGFVDQFWGDPYGEAQYVEGDFISEYAATNPGEDIAESFAYFVLRDRNLNAATAAELKLDYFYQYPELVQLRKHMRGRIVYLLSQ